MELENVAVQSSVRLTKKKIKAKSFKKQTILDDRLNIKKFLEENFNTLSVGAQILCDFIIILIVI